MAKLQALWAEFRNVLRCYNAFETLNDGISEGVDIHGMERRLGLTIPKDMLELYALNNGQCTYNVPIFKAVSGWDVYHKLTFLPLDKVATAYTTFVSHDVLREEFGQHVLPFATNTNECDFSVCYAIDIKTQHIFFIWCDYCEPWNPPEWQVVKFHRGNDLAEFISIQIAYYE